jgi:hypothetical protein
MALDRARIANLLSVVLSRGAGYAVLTSVLLIKKLQISSAAFVTIGHDLVLAALILGPVLSAIGQIQARRIVVSRDIRKNIKPVYFVSAAALAFLLAGQLGSLPESLWGYSLRTIVISCGFMLVHGTLGWLILWTVLCHAKPVFLGVCGIVSLGIAFIIGARLFIDIQFERDTLLFEGFVLFAALNLIVVFLRIIPSLDTVAASVYPFSWTTISRYVVIVMFASGALALDWQLLKSFLLPNDYQHIAEIRIYFERFLLPLLATLASASLLNAYRTKVSGGTSNKIKSRLSRKQTLLAEIAFAIVAISLVSFWPLNTTLWILVLGVGYVMFSINSFCLDLFQAQVSVWQLVVTLGLFLLVYGIVAGVVIAETGIAGHVVVWCVGNFLLFNILRLRTKTAESAHHTLSSVGGVAP